jgi:hypothetical protein
MFFNILIIISYIYIQLYSNVFHIFPIPYEKAPGFIGAFSVCSLVVSLATSRQVVPPKES